MADGKIVIDVQLNDRDAEKAAKGLGSKLNGVAKTGFGVFTKSVSVVGTALGLVGGAAIKTGMDFEQGMSKVAAISDASKTEVASLTEKAKEMGAKTKFSATESAEAFKYMATAGWKTGDMLNGIDGIMNLAAASGEELALTSDIVTDAITSFGMSAKDSSKFADVLATASSNSNTNVAMLGESFKYVAPLAGSLGYNAKDTSIALGLMANSGIKASQAGTSLKTALVNMAKPTDKMQAIMDKYGLSLTDSNGKMKSLKEVMDELRGKMGGLDKATQSAAAAQLFGKESLAGMLSIINASPEDYEKLTNAIYTSDGACKKLSDTMNDNLRGQVNLLKSALEGLAIEFYESVDNPLKDIAKSANGMVAQLSKAFKNGGVNGLVKELGTVFSQIVTNIANSAPKIIDASIIVIQSFITGIQNNLPQITKASIKIMESLVNGFITLLPQLLELGLKFIIQLGQGLAEGAPNLIPMVTDLVIKLSDMFIANLPTIIDLGIKILMGLVEGLVTALPTLIEQVPRIINDLASAIYSQLPTIVLAGVKIIGMLIEGLIKSIPTIIANIPQIIMAIFNAITLFNWASAGKKVIVKIGEGLKSMRGNIGNIAKNIAQWVGDSIKRIFSGGLSWGRNLISNIGRGFSSMGTYLKDLAGSIARGAVNRVKDFFASAKSIGSNLVKGLWNGIKDTKTWILNKIGGWAGSVVQGIKDFFDIHSPSRLMRDEVGVMLIKGIGEGFVRGVGTVKKTINNSLSGVMDGLNTSDLSAKLTHTVNMEQIKMTKGLNRGITQTSNNVTNHNNNGLTLNIENFNNERQQDVESLSEELEFYRRQNALVTGGV